MPDTDGRQHHAQSTSPGRPGWPAGVRPIAVEGLSHIGVGNDGTLYWDGKPIEVRRSLTLTLAQRVGAVVVAISAVAAAIAAMVSAYADVMSLGCK